jgi:hypothetical protein
MLGRNHNNEKLRRGKGKGLVITPNILDAVHVGTSKSNTYAWIHKATSTPNHYHGPNDNYVKNEDGRNAPNKLHNDTLRRKDGLKQH